MDDVKKLLDSGSALVFAVYANIFFIVYLLSLAKDF